MEINGRLLRRPHLPLRSCTRSTQEVEAGRFLSSRPVWSTE
uniref:Uncharacterized protein n=1 Tax=Trichinella nativa TaxID=6335 RepID=A0A0V1KH37_9BILA